MDLLYKRFHENVLDSFGFRSGAAQQQQQAIPARKVEDSYQTNQNIQARNTQPVVIQGKRTPTNSV